MKITLFNVSPLNDSIQDYLSKNHTPLEVKAVIMQQLHNWLETTRIINTQHDIDIPDLNLAATQQSAIGWKHFIRGRLTIEWGNIIHRHLQKENITNMNAEKWGSDLLYINWKHVLKIWRVRCEELHGTTPEQIEINKKLRQIEEIRNLQANNPNLAHTELEWILEDITNIQHYSSTNLETWLYEPKFFIRY
jgi:hypothetical protein